MPKHLHKIHSFYKKNRRMPSYGEIAQLLGFKSKNAAYKVVRKLLDEGFLKKDTQGKLLPHRLGELAVLGSIEAGFPSAAEEELVDTLSLDQWLLERPESTFMLKVSGMSMSEAGIMPGDMVLAERGRSATDGDIVIAEVDHAWTLKRLRKSGKKVYLQAENKSFENIIPEEELNIAAVVIGVVRKY